MKSRFINTTASLCVIAAVALTPVFGLVSNVLAQGDDFDITRHENKRSDNAADISEMTAPSADAPQGYPVIQFPDDDTGDDPQDRTFSTHAEALQFLRDNRPIGGEEAPELIIHNLNAAGADIGDINLAGISCKGCDFSDVDFGGQDLTGTSFVEGTRLDNTKWEGAYLGATFIDAEGVDLEGLKKADGWPIIVNGIGPFGPDSDWRKVLDGQPLEGGADNDGDAIPDVSANQAEGASDEDQPADTSDLYTYYLERIGERVQYSL